MTKKVAKKSSGIILNNISKKELELVMYFLDQLSNDLSNNRCNDYEFPLDWSKKDQQKFVKEYHEMNGDPEMYDPSFAEIPDFCVVALLQHKLQVNLKVE